MRKLLSIVLALTLVLGMLPVFANEYAQEGLSPAENLRHYKFIQGDNGDLKLDQTLTRAELATIISRMLGKDEEAKAFEAETTYDDRAKFPKWAKGYISFATAQGLMVGYDNKFDANGTVNSKQAATVFLRLLGYNQGEDFQYKEAVQFLRDKGVDMVDADKILRADLFDAMWTVVSTEVMKEEGKILGAEHGMLPPPAPKFVPIAIDEVKADNLKEVTVKFNQEIKKDELGTFAIKGYKLTSELMEDGMTVKLTTDTALKNQKEFTLVIEKTAAVNELAGTLAKEERKFVAFDATLPTVTNVEFAGPKDLVITFSEPVGTAGDIVVKQGSVTISINKSQLKVNNTNKATAQVYQNFVEGKEYAVQITKFKDLAGYENVNYSNNLTYTKDTAAPTVEVVAANPTTVTVKFSKPVKGLAANQFYHSFSAWNAIKLFEQGTKTAVTPSSLVTSVDVVFYEGNATDKALPEGNVKFGIMGDKISDLWGNKVAQFEETVAIKADNEKPVATVKVKDNKNITVTFNKEVKFTNVADHFTVLDSKNNKLVINDVTPKAGKEFNIALRDSQEGNTVTLKISGIQDVTPSKNTMVPVDEVVSFGDTTAPEVAAVSFKDNADNTVKHLFIEFKESVTDTALNGANYRLKQADGSYLKLTDYMGSFDGSDKLVRFDVAKGDPADPNKVYTAIVAAADKLIIENVQDLAGLTIVPIAHQIQAHAAVQTITVSSVDAFDTKVDSTMVGKLVVTTNIDVKFVDKDLLSVVDNGGAKVAEIASVSFDQKEITIILDKLLPSDAKSAGNPIKLDIKANAIGSNYEGSTVAVGQHNLVDKIGPRAVLTADKAHLNLTSADAGTTISFAFDEALNDLGGNAAALLRASITVETKEHGTDAWVKLQPVDGSFTVAHNADKKIVDITLVGAAILNDAGDAVRVTITTTEFMTDAGTNKATAVQKVGTYVKE